MTDIVIVKPYVLNFYADDSEGKRIHSTTHYSASEALRAEKIRELSAYWQKHGAYKVVAVTGLMDKFSVGQLNWEFNGDFVVPEEVEAPNGVEL